MVEAKVRAQYHFRMSPQGLCAWDARRLVELSRTLSVESVLLSAFANWMNRIGLGTPIGV
jgi:hypothetical protein